MQEALSEQVQIAIDEKFSTIAAILCDSFPQLDLSFNLIEGSSTALCFLEGVSDDPLSLELLEADAWSIVLAASMEIKVSARLFDA